MTTQTKQILKMQGAIDHLPIFVIGFFSPVVKKKKKVKGSSLVTKIKKNEFQLKCFI